jgi:methylenetetrahydrofolate dehydrogenase (NADP+) / methenyltetrahydrofolate cyclohydrolase
MTMPDRQEPGTGAILLDGRAAARQIETDIAAQISALRETTGQAPGLAVLQIGEDPASASYVRAISRACSRVGITFSRAFLEAEASSAVLSAALDRLNADPQVNGIIVQFPVPTQLYNTVLKHMPAYKDVDGIHPLNVGLVTLGDPQGFVPATPLGGMELLLRSGIPLEGRRAVVVGRSAVVGRPMALLLLHAHATVTVCHTRTVALAEITRTADVLVVATGRPRTISGEMVRPGAAVIDFGVNFVEGMMVGDVDTDAVARVAAYITPVPGGTGPMTNAMLMQNTLRAARQQWNLG